MSTLLYGSDGKLYDEAGYQVDSAGRRFLQKMPHILEKIRNDKAKALENLRSREEKFDKTPEGKAERFLRERLVSLEEDVFHHQCHQTFLDEISSLRGFEKRTDEVDEQIRQLKRYRSHLVDLRADRVKLTKANFEAIKRKTIEIENIKAELAIKEASSSPRTKTPRSETDKKRAQAEKLVSILSPRVLQQYRDQGVSKEQLVEKLMGSVQ